MLQCPLLANSVHRVIDNLLALWNRDAQCNEDLGKSKKLYAIWTVNDVFVDIYRKVAISNSSHLEAHAGFFILLMKGIFDSYVL